MTYTFYRKIKADKAKKNDHMNGEVELLAHYRKVTGADKKNINGHYQAKNPHSMTNLHLRRMSFQ